MWRVIVGSLTAVFISIGQAWAIPTDVSTTGMLNCPSGCQAGSSLTVARSIQVTPSNPDGAFFFDRYSFDLTGLVDMTGKGFALDFLPASDIENLTFSLFDSTLTNLGSFAVPNGSGGPFEIALSFSSLATGAYALLVSGFIPGGMNGAYLMEADFSAAVSQVPLPPAMWLFLSALMGMFSLSQMRKRTPAA